MVLALDLVPVNDTEAEGMPLKSLDLGQRVTGPLSSYLTGLYCLYLLVWHRPQRRSLLDMEELRKLYKGAAEAEGQREVEPCPDWRHCGM